MRLDVWRLLAGAAVSLVFMGCGGGGDGGPPDGAASAPDGGPEPMDCVPALDVDEDGEVDDRCEGGTDCDDDDPSVGANRPEVCDNGTDDDCDGSTDEAGEGAAGCVPAAGATCATPSVVTASGSLALALYPGASEAATCGTTAPGRPDDALHRHVLRVDLATPSSLFVSTMSGPSTGHVAPAIASVDPCGGAVTQCSQTFGRFLDALAILSIPELPAGSHWLEIAGPFERVDGRSNVVPVEILIGPPTAPPANDTCATATEVPSTGGSFDVALGRGTDDETSSCVPDTDLLSEDHAAAPTIDTYYTFELAEPADLNVAMTTRTPGSLYGLSIRAGGCDGATEVRCVTSLVDSWLDATAAPEARVRSLPPGRYTVVIEGPRHAQFTVDFAFGPPTTSPPAESCDAPLRLTDGVIHEDTLIDRDIDLLEFQCAATDVTRPGDAVFDFVIDERSDVSVTVESAGAMLATANIEADCEATGTVPQLCREVTIDYDDRTRPLPLRTRALGLEAGHYFVTVVANSAGDFSILYEAEPAVTPTVVTGAEACDDAHLLPAGGGRFRGTFSGDDVSDCADVPGLATPEAVFRLDVAASALVRAYAYPPPGSAEDAFTVIIADDACDPDALPLCRNIVTVDPGTYYLVVQALDTRPEPGGDFDYELTVEVVP